MRKENKLIKKIPDFFIAKTFAENLTIIIPAYNEAKSIGDTVKSLKEQTYPPKEIIVIDDFSSDGTGEIARNLKVVTICPPKNTGSKAGAQNFALTKVETEFVMAIDADTTLAANAIEKLAPAFNDEKVAAACGFVLPRYVRTVWERGRYIEYMFAFTFYKQIQDYFKYPIISSGCFSAYRTDILKKLGGWSTRTMAEDMDLTWTMYAHGHKVRFIPEAVSYPIEPHNFEFISKQLKRWSHGYVQNITLHWKKVLQIPYLQFMIAVSFWDALIATIVYLFLLPILSIYFKTPYFLLGYFIDFPAILIPALVGAWSRGWREMGRVIISLPPYFVLRTVNSIFILNAFVSEWLLGRRLKVYEKGH